MLRVVNGQNAVNLNTVTEIRDTIALILEVVNDGETVFISST